MHAQHNPAVANYAIELQLEQLLIADFVKHGKRTLDPAAERERIREQKRWRNNSDRRSSSLLVKLFESAAPPPPHERLEPYFAGILASLRSHLNGATIDARYEIGSYDQRSFVAGLEAGDAAFNEYRSAFLEAA